MKRLMFAAVVLASLTASAGDFSFRGEGSAAMPLGLPQAQYFFPGPNGQLTVLYGLTPWLSVEVQGSFFKLPATGFNGLTEGTSGLSVGPGVRLQMPAEGKLFRPWFELAVEYHRSGSLDTVALAPGVGINFRLAPTHALWFGPQLRYLHAFLAQAAKPDPAQVYADSNMLFLGLGLEFDLHFAPAPKPEPVAPPPNPDPDGDRVNGADDACPDVAGLAALHGCPDHDSDGDGVMDLADRCVNQPEDLDGHDDADGCPEVEDADGDTVPDQLDQCPKVAGLVENKGCPKVEEKQVRVADTKIEILQKILFATGKDTIQPGSFALLDEVAGVLKLRTAVCVAIEGHTDNLGDPKKNLELSKVRALAVQAYLVNHGVENERLTAQGFGDTQPLESNAQPDGREHNRRVVFNIVSCQRKGAQ